MAWSGTNKDIYGAKNEDLNDFVFAFRVIQAG